MLLVYYKCFSTVVVLMGAWFPFSRSGLILVLLFVSELVKACMPPISVVWFACLSLALFWCFFVAG
jgi:hypothetical protein